MLCYVRKLNAWVYWETDLVCFSAFRAFFLVSKNIAAKLQFNWLYSEWVPLDKLRVIGWVQLLPEPVDHDTLAGSFALRWTYFSLAR